MRHPASSMNHTTKKKRSRCRVAIRVAGLSIKVGRGLARLSCRAGVWQRDPAGQPGWCLGNLLAARGAEDNTAMGTAHQRRIRHLPAVDSKINPLFEGIRFVGPDRQMICDGGHTTHATAAATGTSAARHNDQNHAHRPPRKSPHDCFILRARHPITLCRRGFFGAA